MKRSYTDKLFALASLMITFLTGCGAATSGNLQQVLGEYVFHYKTGEVETLILCEDLTYKQQFYESLGAYKDSRTPKYTNKGTWSFAKKQIRMNHFLMFCDYPNPGKFLEAPKHFAWLDASWQPKKLNKWEASIWLSEDFHYVLIRVNSRADVK